MTSFIFDGKLMHSRRAEVNHHFVYGVFMLLLDLDDLPALDRHLPFFTLNRRGVVSIQGRDHLPHPSLPDADLKAMALARFAEGGLPLAPDSKIYMLTNPRIVGYCFNPLTVYYGYDAGGTFQGVLMEVSNTHREQHPYVVYAGNEIPHRRAEESKYGMRRFAAPKTFYVSPFIPMNALYELSITPIGEHVIVHLDEYWDGALKFQARLWGETKPLTAGALRAALIRYPFMTLKVIGAIHWEGIRLLRKRAPYLSWKRYKERAKANPPTP